MMQRSHGSGFGLHAICQENNKSRLVDKRVRFTTVAESAAN